MNINPMLLTDFYKVEHRSQYPDNTTLVYSNFTPRKSRIDGINEVVFFGLQYFIKRYLIEGFNKYFFDIPKKDAVASYKRILDHTLGKDKVKVDNVEDLHDLGYLPLRIKALPEGTRCPIGVPMMTIVNTDDNFAWLTNFIESVMSTTLWMPITSATIAARYREILDFWAMKTVGNTDFVQWQAHDFSFRGMAGVEASMLSGAGHLLSFTGTDTIPAILFLEEYYNANVENELVGSSVIATEHSCMMAGGKENERETYRRLIEDVYPEGILSIVSDTWNLWNVLTDILPSLHDSIMARDGKVVIRPDSGDPVEIICGKNIPDLTEDREDFFYFLQENGKDELFTFQGELWEASASGYQDMIEEYGNDVKEVFRFTTLEDLEYAERQSGGVVYRSEKQIPQTVIKGVVELLWDEFGGEVNGLGYKVLDPHVGAIYGDSITPTRAIGMCEELAAKGFASTNVVLGVGSYTYQYNTRDTFGMAMKATYCEVAGEARAIFKDPITDDGTKKSLKGLLTVERVDGKLRVRDQVSWEEEAQGELKPVFYNGVLLVDQTLSEIRQRLKGEI